MAETVWCLTCRHLHVLLGFPYSFVHPTSHCFTKLSLPVVFVLLVYGVCVCSFCWWLQHLQLWTHSLLAKPFLPFHPQCHPCHFVGFLFLLPLAEDDDVQPQLPNSFSALSSASEMCGLGGTVFLMLLLSFGIPFSRAQTRGLRQTRPRSS